MLTQLRVAGYVSMDRAYYPTILIGIIHFLVALAVAVKTRNAAWYAYVIAIPIAFIGMGAVTPIGAVWGLAYMTYWFWL
jgi:uncharacterized protein (DUF983 family)